MPKAFSLADRAHDQVVEWLEHFEPLEDPPQSGKVWYPLDEVLLLCLLAGPECWVEIAEFGKAKIEFLRRFRAFEKGTPWYDQLGDLFAALDAEAFQQCFINWVASLTKLGPDIVAIDGKALRRSYQQGGAKAPIHMIPAWSSRQRPPTSPPSSTSPATCRAAPRAKKLTRQTPPRRLERQLSRKAHGGRVKSFTRFPCASRGIGATRTIARVGAGVAMAVSIAILLSGAYNSGQWGLDLLLAVGILTVAVVFGHLTQSLWGERSRAASAVCSLMFIAASCLSAYNTVGRTAEGSETKAADAQAHTDELAQIKADLEENGER